MKKKSKPLPKVKEEDLNKDGGNFIVMGVKRLPDGTAIRRIKIFEMGMWLPPQIEHVRVVK